MRRSFCNLEKDDKTFSYFIQYYQAICSNTLAWHLDNDIQRAEINDHLARHPEAPDIAEEKLRWIDDNSVNFRSYLNSIKILALFSTFVTQLDLVAGDMNHFPRETFHRMVDLWNQHKILLIDSIFI